MRKGHSREPSFALASWRQSVHLDVLRKRNPGGCPRIGVRVVQGVGETLGFEGEIRKHVRSSINPREQCPNLHPKNAQNGRAIRS